MSISQPVNPPPGIADSLTTPQLRHEDATIEDTVAVGTTMEIEEAATSSSAVPSDKKKRRHFRRAGKQKELKQKADAKKPSGHGFDMTYLQRCRLVNALIHQSLLIRGSCIYPLPACPLDSEERIPKIPKMMDIWWDWLDECRQVLDSLSYTETISRDWSTLEVVFGTLSKLQGIYGQDYLVCQANLAERDPWVSRYASDHARLEEAQPAPFEGKYNTSLKLKSSSCFYIEEKEYTEIVRDDFGEEAEY